MQLLKNIVDDPYASYYYGIMYTHVHNLGHRRRHTQKSGSKQKRKYALLSLLPLVLVPLLL